MNPTELYFKFPARIFDPHSAARARKKAEAEFSEKEKIEYVIGMTSLPFEEITNSAWHETYMSHRAVDNVKEKGCDSTMILTPHMGEYMCAWKIEKFEHEYNEYVKMMQKFFHEQALAAIPPPSPQLSRWARFKIWLSRL